MLHNDATRLFANTDEDGKGEGWQNQLNVKYRSYKQGARHEERDAHAFISVGMPAHYTAVYAVLSHLKHRMGPDFNVERVLDWGSGAFSGLW